MRDEGEELVIFRRKWLNTLGWITNGIRFVIT